MSGTQPDIRPKFDMTPGQARLKKSPVWKYFLEVYEEPYAICKLCTRKVSRGGTGKKAGTSALRNHLRNKHSAAFDQVLNTSQHKMLVVLEASNDRVEVLEPENQQNEGSCLKLKRTGMTGNKENNSNDTINDCEEDPEQDGPQQNDGCLKAERPDTPEPEPSTFTNKVDEAVNDSVNDIPPDALTDRKKPDEDEYDLFGRSLAIQLRKLPELDALDLMHKVQLMVISKKKQIQQAASRKRTIHAQKTVISKRSLRSSSPMHVLSRSPSPSTSPETEVFAQFANTNSCLEDPLTPGQIRVKKENMN
ncbi:uncharacterized protein LOC126373337 isoform X4 [Pectinophora gossypiella]|uniref:uncharacterized protein LOC126373337 isoform X4 n=1 Tax=Pectinophora gossypiella TaxID=13191 RepID=UPI00214E3D62|nr:uncharacterized protein LOC126373337 isoform X4 [Pectinophora gossypiella]